MNKGMLYSKFVKYDILDRLIINNPSASILMKSPVDIYIDIQSIYKRVLSETLLASDEKVLSVNILNLAGHYRHYFMKHGINSRIYLINGSNNITTIVSKINNDNKKKMFNIVQKTVQYFPLTYYIEKEYNSSAIIMSLIESDTMLRSHSAFIVSNDIYSYQIPSIYPIAFLLRPSTNTKLVTSNNVIDAMYPRKGNTITSDISSALLPIIMAYHKCPELGMTMINNFKTTIDIIRNKINTNQILNAYNSPIMFKNESEEILNRIYLSDLVTITKTYTNSYESLINNWKIYKPYNTIVLTNVLDNTFNKDANNLFNYIFLLEVEESFFNHVGP